MIRYYICPICGYDKLEEAPYDKDNYPSYGICPCCFNEFGFDDDNQNFSSLEEAFNYLNTKWKEDKVFYNKDLKPKNWNPDEQLQNLKKINIERSVYDS